MQIYNGLALHYYFENLEAMLGNDSFLRFLGDLDNSFIKRANDFQKELNALHVESAKVAGMDV